MLIWSQQYTSLHGQIYIDYYWLYSPIIIANPALLPSNFFSHLQSSVPRLNQNLVGLRSVILLLTYKSVFVPVFDARQTEIVTSKSLTCQLNVYHPFFSPFSISLCIMFPEGYTGFYIYIHTYTVQDYACDAEVSWCNWRLTLFTRWPPISRSEGIDPWVMFPGNAVPIRSIVYTRKSMLTSVTGTSLQRVV